MDKRNHRRRLGPGETTEAEYQRNEEKSYLRDGKKQDN